MKNAIIIAGLAIALSGCTAGAVTYGAGPDLEPIPGSITYGGQPRSRLIRSPIGSVVNHEFRNEFGQRVEERYILQPDRSLRLVSRRVYRGPLWDDD
ncbi:hypothetical protein [Rhizobium sp. LCM 4573]|uniref:hypothetical protein n=1 Tax=Rhizobium sp. LCM 4573 TaxID=1848291 RepID=UPI0008D951CE|nr:hypothetical protein [Rhizobium sp. LCM 4573]OHV85086.1 hypothetical protein LCM4573_02535 [Rhizobium sp. LCM 4573]